MHSTMPAGQSGLLCWYKHTWCYAHTHRQHSPDCSALCMLPRKMEMNHSREYWYMGSMLARSVVQKKRICVRTATGMYRLRVASMSFSVCSADATLA